MTGSPEEQDWDAYPPGTAPQYAPAPTYGPQPGYGPPPGYGWYPLPPPAWPNGPGRPPLATTAAVLGFVTAGLTILVSGALLVGALNGDYDDITLLLTLGLPCAAGLIAGGVRLQGRRSPALLFGSAVAAVVVLLLAWLAGALTIDRTGGMEGLTAFVLSALVLPSLTAIFAWTRTVRAWAAARPS